MHAQMPCFDDLEERQRTIRRRLRRLQRALAAGFILFGTIAAVAAVENSAFEPQVVESQSLTVKDANGNLRGLLIATEDGPRLTLFGPNGARRVLLAYSHGGGFASLAACDGNSKERALVLCRDDQVFLSVIDDPGQRPVGEQRITLSVSDALKPNESQILINDANGQTVATLGTSEGTGVMRLNDPQGNLIAGARP